MIFVKKTDSDSDDYDNGKSNKWKVNWWIKLGGWFSMHLALLPFLQGCMFSIGFYFAKLQLMPLLKLTNNNK